MLIGILYSNPIYLCTYETRDIVLDCESIVLDCESIVFYTSSESQILALVLGELQHRNQEQ